MMCHKDQRDEAGGTAERGSCRQAGGSVEVGRKRRVAQGAGTGTQAGVCGQLAEALACGTMAPVLPGHQIRNPDGPCCQVPQLHVTTAVLRSCVRRRLHLQACTWNRRHCFLGPRYLFTT